MRLVVLLLVLSSPLADGSFPVRIQNIKGDKVAVRPYTAPLLIMQIKQGSPLQGSVAECKQEILTKDFRDHGETEIQFICGDVRMVLKGVYFGE